MAKDFFKVTLSDGKTADFKVKAGKYVQVKFSWPSGMRPVGISTINIGKNPEELAEALVEFEKLCPDIQPKCMLSQNPDVYLFLFEEKK